MMTIRENKKRKKINFSIKKGMQARLIFRIFIIILLAVILSGVIFWIGSQRKVASTYYQFHVQLRNFRDLILPLAILGMIAGLLGALVLSLFFPQRLAGPLYRIEKKIERVANGDLSDPNLIIRSGDELHDLARHVARLTGKMREKALFLKEINKRLDVSYHQIKDGTRDSETEMIKEAISSLEEELKKMRDILNEFKV